MPKAGEGIPFPPTHTFGVMNYSVRVVASQRQARSRSGAWSHPASPRGIDELPQAFVITEGRTELQQDLRPLYRFALMIAFFRSRLPSPPHPHFGCSGACFPPRLIFSAVFTTFSDVHSLIVSRQRRFFLCHSVFYIHWNVPVNFSCPDNRRGCILLLRKANGRGRSAFLSVPP